MSWMCSRFEDKSSRVFDLDSHTFLQILVSRRPNSHWLLRRLSKGSVPFVNPLSFSLLSESVGSSVILPISISCIFPLLSFACKASRAERKRRNWHSSCSEREGVSLQSGYWQRQPKRVKVCFTTKRYTFLTLPKHLQHSRKHIFTLSRPLCFGIICFHPVS